MASNARKVQRKRDSRGSGSQPSNSGGTDAPRRDWSGYVRSPPREINERIVQIDGASFADAARDFGHRDMVGKWVYG
jgi:hypothetical protein